MKYRVIALVGPLASGKGTLIELLQEKGYESVSLSDEVREKASIWGLTPTRENLQNVGDKLRKSFGLSILAELVGQKIAKNPKVNFVIDGVRNPGELQYLKKEFDAYSIGITASPQKRFALIKKRKRQGDPLTWEEFKKAEERDRGVGQESYGQQVQACLDASDVVIDNNGTLRQLQTNSSYFLTKIL